MEIIKELNKSDAIESIKNGSITHSVNIIVSKDGHSIQNENSFETVVEFPNDTKIVGAIPCATEIVIFTDKNEIYRYDESTSELTKVESVWKWAGGEVFGTYTYNILKNLIIAISERNTDNIVPLKIINLDDAMVENEDAYTLDTAIPVPTILKESIIQGNAIKRGTYVFYIRFGINNSDFSRWIDLGGIYNITNNITNKKISSITVQMSAWKTENFIPTYFLEGEGVEKTELVEKAIQLDIQIDSTGLRRVFKYYQICYICTYDGGSEGIAFPPAELDEGIVTYTINTNSSDKTTIDTDSILSGMGSFGIYNAKTLCNYGNRLYVANFKESTTGNKLDYIDTSNIKVGVYDYDDRENDIYGGKSLPVESEVYRFFIHYVRKDGSNTEGILIENRDGYDSDRNLKIYKIKLGSYTPTNQVPEIIYGDITIYTKVSEVKQMIEDARNNPKYTDYTDNVAKHTLSLIAMAEAEQTDYYYVNLDPIFDVNSVTRKTYCATYINNRGNKLFRTPYYVKGNFFFEGIEMYEDFIGYFISYQKIESIVVAEGIIDRHREDVGNLANNSQQQYGNIQEYYKGDVLQFYSDDMLVTKNAKRCNIAVYLHYIEFKIQNLAKGSIWGDYRDVSQHILWGDGSNQWNGKYNYTTGDSKTDRAIHNIPIGVNTELQNGLAGIYYIVNQSIPTFYFTIGLRPDPYNNNKDIYKSVPVVKMLSVSQDIYFDTKPDNLIRLGKTKYVDFKTSPKSNTYGTTTENYNVTGEIGFGLTLVYDRKGVVFGGNWCPNYNPSISGRQYFNRSRASGEASENIPRDVLHVNQIRYYKSFKYRRYQRDYEAIPASVVYTYNTPEGAQNIENIQLDPASAYNLYKIPEMFTDYLKSVLIAYDPNALSQNIPVYDTYIRRSDVIQSESDVNAWRNFSPSAYKVIAENKGAITNIVGIGLYLIAHCEHSMFLFNRDSTLLTKDKDVQMYIPDAFDTNYQEVFTTERGYGGLQDYNAFICNEAGYIFFDRSKRKLYRFDEKELNDITNDIQVVIDKFVEKDSDINIGMDKENERILLSFTGEKYIYTFSYSLLNNSWISMHTHYASNYYNTKQHLYAINDSSPNILAKIDTNNSNSFLNYGNFIIPIDKNPIFTRDNQAIIDITFNLEYDTIKLLNYIKYNIKKEDNINYSGDKIIIFTNSCISKETDVSMIERNIYNHKKPYYEQGQWNYNYFRNLIQSVIDTYPVDRITGKYLVDIKDGEEDLIISDKEYSNANSLINGKFITVRFIINQTDSKVLLSNIELFVNKYRE